MLEVPVENPSTVITPKEENKLFVDYPVYDQEQYMKEYVKQTSRTQYFMLFYIFAWKRLCKTVNLSTNGSYNLVKESHLGKDLDTKE